MSSVELIQRVVKINKAICNCVWLALCKFCDSVVVVGIEKFPIIGFYLYHDIEAMIFSNDYPQHMFSGEV